MTKRLEKWIPLLILAAVIIAYANSFNSSFMFDDAVMITQKQGIDRLWPLSWSTRCLVDLSFKANYAVGGLNVVGYHAVNIAIHIIACFLLFAIIRRTLALPSMRFRYGDAGPWLAGVCAILWAVHPLQTESVTYIAQRYESMMGVFYLLVLYFFVRSGDSAKKGLWYGMALLAFAVGMCTKEIILTAPIVVFLYDHIFLCGSFRKYLIRNWWVLLCLACLMVVFALILKPVIESTFRVEREVVAGVSPLQYLFTEFGVIVHYLRLAVFPYPLCLDYAWPIASGLGEILPYGLMVGLLILATLWAMIKRRPFGFIGGWFFIILAPTSSIIPVRDAAFEHRMYLPLAGVIIFLIMFGYQIQEKILSYFRVEGLRKYVYSVLMPAILSGAFIGMTAMRNADYRSEEAMWRQVIECRPANLRPYIGLGLALAKQGQIKEAEECFKEIIKRLPVINSNSGRDLDSTIYARAQNAMGVIREKEGNHKEAEGNFREAIRVAPGYVEARNNLGIVLREIGRTSEAVDEWDKALGLSQGDGLTDHGLTHYCLARALEKDGNYKDAIHHFDAAMKFSVYKVNAQIELAWLLATCAEAQYRDGDRALLLVKDAYKSFDAPGVRILDVQGAALAQAGRFEEAIKFAEQAHKMAEEIGMSGIDCIRDRISLYKEGKPYISIGFSGE